MVDQRWRHVHFLGIGGIGMRALAQVLLQHGCRVTGYDKCPSEAIDSLVCAGAEISTQENPRWVKCADLLVYSSAINCAMSESVRAAHQHEIPVWHRSQLLEALLQHKRVIAIAGSHGKTTTSALLLAALRDWGHNPSFFVGGEMPGEAVVGHDADTLAIVEADESDGSFLRLQPQAVIVTNIDGDHLDFYHDDLQQQHQAFHQFMSLVPTGDAGLVVMCADCPTLKAMPRPEGVRVVSYGFADHADVQLTQCDHDGGQVRCVLRSSLACLHNQSVLVPVAGRHNLLNGVAGLIVARLTLATKTTLPRLANFAGVQRRFQWHGRQLLASSKVGIDIYEDYGHHPTELAAVESMVRDAWPGRRLVWVFQPHRYSRTQRHLSEFASVLARADAVCLLPVYAASEDKIVGADSHALQQAMLGCGQESALVEEADALCDRLLSQMQADDVVVFQGAGNVGGFATELRWRLSQQKTSMAPIRGKQQHQYSLLKHNSWRVGGMAECCFFPEDVADLRAGLASQSLPMPYHFVGLGSNVLLRDGGIKGTVIMFHPGMQEMQVLADGRVYVEAGVACAKFARFCARQGLAGAAFFAGIPGTVGGALAMNAGAFGGESWRQVEAVDILSEVGVKQTLPKQAFKVAYREVHLPYKGCFVAGYFRFHPGDVAEEQQAIKQLLAKRAESQPIGALSCGSVFRNPQGNFAAELIEQCGLKGYRIGGAVVSEKHANFILNDDKASAKDIEQLIAWVQQQVHEQTGQWLLPEVKIMGEPSE